MKPSGALRREARERSPACWREARLGDSWDTHEDEGQGARRRGGRGPRNWRCSGDGTLEAGCWGWKPTCLASPAPGSACSPGSDSQDPYTCGSLHRHVLLHFRSLPSSWKRPRGSSAASLRPQPHGLPQLGFSAASLQPPVPGEAGGDHLLSPTAGLKWFSWGAQGARAVKRPTSAQVMTWAPGTSPESVSPLSKEPAHPHRSARPPPRARVHMCALTRSHKSLKSIKILVCHYTKDNWGHNSAHDSSVCAVANKLK